MHHTVRRTHAQITVEECWPALLRLRWGATWGDATVPVKIDDDGRWSAPGPAREETCALLDLYAPLCVPDQLRCIVVAHLAQSLDGRIATASGVSQFISGRADIVHTHRLRALADAVVVGAGTVEHDNPHLTTREIQGPNPARVVIDPQRRLKPDHAVFRDDSAPTWIVCRADAPARATGASHVGVATVEPVGDSLPPAAILSRLSDLGLKRLMIEGGGRTVSRFLDARLLDRLHVTVAPIILGSGRPVIDLPPIDSLAAAIRPVSTEVHRLGEDVLFDLRLR